MKKPWLWLIIILALLALAWFLLQSLFQLRPVPPEEEEELGESQRARILQSLEDELPPPGQPLSQSQREEILRSLETPAEPAPPLDESTRSRILESLSQ